MVTTFDLGLSVGVTNVILWALIEVFGLWCIMTGTRETASLLRKRKLLSERSVTLNEPRTWVDFLYYNSDLRDSSPRSKFLLTLIRTAIVACTIYVGSTIDGSNVRIRNLYVPEGMTVLARSNDTRVINNDGQDIAAMARMSCEKIVDNDVVLLYSGLVDSQRITCLDGITTVEEVVIASTSIRTADRTPLTGEDMQDLHIYQEFLEGKYDNIGEVVVNPRSITVNVSRNGDEDDAAMRLVLRKQMQPGSNVCEFGIWRAPSGGFLNRVDIVLRIACDFTFVNTRSLFEDKDVSIPPRMDFLRKIFDSITTMKSDPEVDFNIITEEINATVNLPGVIVFVLLVTISVGLLVISRVLQKALELDIPNVGDVNELASVVASHVLHLDRCTERGNQLRVAITGDSERQHLGPSDLKSMTYAGSLTNLL